LDEGQKYANRLWRGLRLLRLCKYFFLFLSHGIDVADHDVLRMFFYR